MLVVGDVMADVVARHDAPLALASDTPAGVSLRGGGAAGNVAAWAGPGARLVGRVGTDPLAAVALGGLSCEVDPVRPTGVCVVLVGPDGERTMLPDPGANVELPAPGRVDAAVVYVSGYSLLRPSTRAAALGWLEAARAAGAHTVVDPASAAPLADALEFFVRDVRCDLLLPNADEMAVLGARASEIAAEVVVKRGAAGASWSDGGRELSVPAVATPVVDTTGAGDAFAAGFLRIWGGGGGAQAALGAGAALAARAVASEGARPA